MNYFKERVVPKANRLGKWALGEVNISLRKIFVNISLGKVNTFEENILKDGLSVCLPQFN